MVLHLDDPALPQAESLSPFEPVAVRVEPGVLDRHTAVLSPNVVDVEVTIASPSTPFDRGRENLPGLVGAVSGGARSPEPPSLPSPTPLHVRVHECDERLDVAISHGFVCLADSLHEIMVDGT